MIKIISQKDIDIETEIMKSRCKDTRNWDNEIKKVVWIYDWGVLIPVCPSCKEPAYEHERCVFCGQPYLMTPKPIPKLEVYGDRFYAVMPSKTSIYVFEQGTGALVCHEIVDGEWTKEKLLKHLKKIEEGMKK